MGLPGRLGEIRRLGGSRGAPWRGRTGRAGGGGLPRGRGAQGAEDAAGGRSPSTVTAGPRVGGGIAASAASFEGAPFGGGRAQPARDRWLRARLT